MPPSARWERMRYLPSITRPTRASATLDVTEGSLRAHATHPVQASRGGTVGSPLPAPHERPAQARPALGVPRCSEAVVDGEHVGHVVLRVVVQALGADRVDALVVAGDGLLARVGAGLEGPDDQDAAGDVVLRVVAVERTTCE